MDQKLARHGMFSWFELQTSDVAAAAAFYSALFGWTTEEMAMPGLPYTVISAGGEQVGGIMAIPPQAKGMPPAWGIYVSVDDVDALAKKARQLGGEAVVPPTDIPKVGRFAVLKDPQGAMITVITYVKKEAAAGALPVDS
jgi:predicted enzyme related to lactoylglutathione lyase